MTKDLIKEQWADLWGMAPPNRMGMVMLQKSINFKLWERETGGLPHHKRAELNNLVKTYRQKPDKALHQKSRQLKPGMRLIRTYKGKKHVVTVIDKGFEYQGQQWSSLTKIANTITGTKWNGWLFFGLKN